MSGEDKAREVLAAAIDEPHLKRRVIEGGELNEGVFLRPAQAIKAMLAFREEGRLAALDEATGVAREWGGQNADGWSWVTGTRDSIATSIKALKDQK